MAFQAENTEEYHNSSSYKNLKTLTQSSKLHFHERKERRKTQNERTNECSFLIWNKMNRKCLLEFLNKSIQNGININTFLHTVSIDRSRL